MNGFSARHLERRSGIFGLRVRVPNDIRPLVGMVEVRRSLRTYDPFRARAQSAIYVARLFKVFEMIRTNKSELDKEYVRAMISASLREIVWDALCEVAPAASRQVAGISSRAPSPAGPTLDEALDTYLAAKRRFWTLKTYKSRQSRLAYLRQHLGGATKLQSVTADDVRSFRDAICRLRRSEGQFKPATFAAKQTENLEQRIDAKTAILIFEPVKAFLRWSKSEQGYILTNPAEDIRIAAPIRVKGRKSRRPFRPEELERLFLAPLFTGCQSRQRRFEPGKARLQDGKYWLPILGYYTGARLGELVQLHISDINLTGSVPFIHITEDGSGQPGTADAKHVKSHAGVRSVPLHPDLIELGFDKFVEQRRGDGSSSRRLFAEVNFGKDGQASTTYSKFFGRVLDRVNLSDPALVFHSFRHGAEDAFRNAGQPQYVIDRIIGHSDSAVSAGYGEGISLETAHAAVSAMKLTVRLPTLWAKQDSTLANPSLDILQVVQDKSDD